MDLQKQIQSLENESVIETPISVALPGSKIIITGQITPEEELAHIYHNDLFQEGKLEVADEIIAHDFVIDNPALPRELQVLRGPKAAKEYAIKVKRAAPHRIFEQNEIFANEDKVVVRWTSKGKNTGKDLWGHPPTGEHYIMTGLDLFHTSKGKIKELWQRFELHELHGW